MIVSQLPHFFGQTARISSSLKNCTDADSGRGFSESYLTGAQDYSQRLETDADDAARLIERLAPEAPPIVIGNSSGAIVSLELLSRHPDLVATVLVYEPPAARFLPDFESLFASAEDVYATYRAAGMSAAYEKFAVLTKTEDSMGLMIRAAPTDDVRRSWNSMYWFEREFMTYPNAEFDVDVDLRPHKGKLVLVNGEESNKEAYQFRANVALAERLGLKIVLFPGAHVGHATCPGDFAASLVEVLASRDQ
jgi:pimeloyl-ACP methyl ester carboxylesterase